MEIKTLLTDIINGKLDEHAKAIKQALDQRADILADLNLISLKVGDRVRIDRITPAVLKGQTGVIHALPRNGNSKRFDVTLDDNDFYIRGMQAQKIQRGIPAVCLTKID
jgi:hypothetical protein